MTTKKRRPKKWVLCMNCSRRKDGDVFHPVSAWPRTHLKSIVIEWRIPR